MVPDPSLTINEVIITSLLFLKIIKGVCHFFVVVVILPHTLLSGFFTFCGKKSMGFGFWLPIQQYDAIITSNCVIVSIKLYLNFCYIRWLYHELF